MTNYKDTKFSPFTINLRQKLFTFERPALLGILNITPDSFYDGGRYRDPEAMLQRAREMVAQGADILDLGAVSSRSGAQLLDPEEERDLLVPAVRLIRSELPEAVISVDTCFALPAEAAINAGADIINDISGGQFDPDMLATAARLQVPYILMHTKGRPSEMAGNAQYGDIIQDLSHYFSERLETLYRYGAKDVILDPGFGFAKTLEQNFELLRRLDELCGIFHEPILAAMSRKSMIYRTLGTTPEEALNGTSVLNTAALLKGASLLRVHDIPQALEAVRLVLKIQNC